MIFFDFDDKDIKEAIDETLPSLYLDANRIQILAPMIACENNVVGGFYAPSEHIGHLSRHFASLISPLFDDSKYSSFEIHCHLLYIDFNHSRAGYAVDVVITSTLTPEENDKLFISLEAKNLNSRRYKTILTKTVFKIKKQIYLIFQFLQSCSMEMIL